MTDSPAKRERPLSPHLQVYKPQLTSFTSILHRATGVALSIGLILVAVWFIAAATSLEAYNAVHSFLGTPLGLILLFGWSFALFYHACNGLRHLFWDMGFLFKIENAYRAGYAVLLISFLLTAGVWFCVYNKYKYGAHTPAQAQNVADAAQYIEEDVNQ